MSARVSRCVRQISASAQPWLMLMRGVNANSAIAAHNTQQTLVVHSVEQSRRGVRCAAPIILHLAMGEMLIDLARVYSAAFANEVEQELRAFSARSGPGELSLANAVVRARMHQRLQGSGYESIVDEKVFLDAEFRVVALKIAGAVILHTMAQNQVLCAGWRAHRISLHKAKFMQRSLQRGGCEQTLVDGETAKVIEIHRTRFVFSRDQKIKPRYTMGV